MEWLLLLFTLGVAVVLGYFFLSSKQTPAGTTVLLLGPVGTGKTVLFYQLLKGAFVETHTSMKENAKRFIPHALLSSTSKSIEFVDFPGHGSHRHKLHSKIASSRVVILMVDAANLSSLQDAAMVLHELFTQASMLQRRSPIFVAINKTDLATAQDTDAITAQLEREIEKRRIASQSRLTDLTPGSSSEGKQFLPDRVFKFADAPLPVEFGRIAAKHGNIEPVIKFLKPLLA